MVRISKMRGMRLFTTVLLIGSQVFLLSCGGEILRDLELREQHLRNLTPPNVEEDWLLRAERQKILYGAVSEEERRLRLGHYYAIHWRDGDDEHEGRLVFEYRQSGNASLVKRVVKTIGFDPWGSLEISITGENYQRGGQVLSWRLRLYRGEKLIAEERSFLW